MAICSRVRVPAIGLAILGFLLVFPLRAECQNAPTPVPPDPCQKDRVAVDRNIQAIDQAAATERTLSNELRHQELSLWRTQFLADDLEFWKSYLVNYLNDVKRGGSLTAEEQKDYDGVSKGLADMTALQVRVAARISVLQKSVDELTARLTTASQALQAASREIANADTALINCVDRAKAALAQTPTALSKTAPTLAPKNLPTTDILATWTLTTVGGCEYAGSTRPVKMHKPDGEMHFVRPGTIDPATGNPVLSTIVGHDIDSVIESWNVDGEHVTVNVHPTSYSDDPETTPPKDKFSGGWQSRLQFKGTFSPDGSISGSVYHDSPKADCTFKMTRN